MMTTDACGLYVHIPFCVKKCNYCDFCSFKLSSAHWRERYIDALCREIESYKGRNISINSIFFGGGTPSLLTARELSKIVEAIRSSFRVLPDTEFTLEVNPKTLDESKLGVYLDCGVNRLSIGLQSIHENELKILGRIHSHDDFLASYKLARSAGIDNINIDLMYGIPEQTIDSFKETLESVLSLSPEHISLYGLILEEGTPLFERRGEIAFPAEDSECDMYYLAAKTLSENGYSHYEISNYAKAGRKSRHNLKYWRGLEYIGVGLAAYSYLHSRRFGNTDRIDEYLSCPVEQYDRGELVDKDAEAYEYVMLRLRLSEGFSLEDYKARFDRDFLSGRERLVDSLIQGGYMRNENGRLSLTESGFYVSNSILTELL